MKKLFTLIIFLLITILIIPQHGTRKKYHAFSGAVVLTLEGGATFPQTDYKGTTIDYIGKASVEYYIPALTRSSFGFRVFGGGGFLSENDENQSPPLIKTDIAFAGAGIIYSLAISKNVYPYVFAGGAYTWFSPKGEDGKKLPNNQAGVYSNSQVNIIGELGFRFLITDNFSFNVNGSAHISTDDYFDDVAANANNDLFYTAMVGFSFSFFTDQDSDGDGISDSEDACDDTPAGIKVDQFGCPLDSDKDGVPDYLDDCPETPVDVKVNRNGCPRDEDNDGIADYMDLCPNTQEGIDVDEFGCPFDRDADGVPDFQDGCPDTPYGVPVNRSGCPNDSDGDGIPDAVDECPDTPRGSKVDEKGCLKIDKSEVREVVLSSATTFEFGSTELSRAAYPQLDELVRVMKRNPDTRWRIEGHTDNIGSDQANRKVSLERAQSVLNYFLSKGLERYRFEVAGMGENYPIASNDTEEGRAKNRRVAIIRIN